MNAVRLFVLAAALSLGAAGAAHAQRANPIFTATFESPAAERQVIAVSTLWNCEGATCVARPAHGVNVRSCRQLVREVGARVTAYGNEQVQLTPDEIARCNGARATQQAQN